MGVADAALSHILYPDSTSVSTLIEVVQGYNRSFVNRRYGNLRPLVRWPEYLEVATLGFRRWHPNFVMVNCVEFSPQNGREVERPTAPAELIESNGWQGLPN